MNKTIYVRDEDVEIWDRAKELAGEKLSPVIAEGLKRFIAEKEAEMAEAKGFERIEVSFRDAADHGSPKRKAFLGKWIITLDEPLDSSHALEDFYRYTAIAETAKGAFVFITWTAHDKSEPWRHFTVFPSLETALKIDNVQAAAVKAMEIRGVPLEELDI